MMQPPNMPDNDDALLRQMKRGNRTPLYVVLAIAAGSLFATGSFVVRNYFGVRSDLSEKGYKDLKVKFVGPFTFGFTGTKGSSECGGTITRYPFSGSEDETCFDTTPREPPPPPLTNRQEVEGSIKKNYAKRGFDHFTCPDIADADTKVTCKVTAPNGCSVDVNVERTKVGSRGEWSEWSSSPATPIVDGEKLDADLMPLILDAVKARRPKLELDIDCGKGPIVFVDGKLTCQLVTHDPKPLHTTVLLTMKDDKGGYNWSVKGL
jgi:hypothetical protein